MVARILISACLLGHPVRYDGAAKPLIHPAIDQWRREGRLVSICPELMAGFAVPRPPAEIAEGRSGEAVLAGHGRVVQANGTDVTELYVAGAQAALALAREHACRFALLIDGSPSCGSRLIHDGTFSGRKQGGAGVTTALLRRHGVEVFANTEIEVLRNRLSQTSGQRIPS
ncbi:conserved protein of unknown function [Rhodovastum atsumiense]|uniref:DUF523 domain-containing protein n=1 Tax=Rhodovastum atsumiense TaxID=504468 RepID=A0A5M6IUA0_9PROT|nr:DUF523 domain-containing protein [Rhodovastum atsumiense]KAA5611437.1 DUF523 domain-containing protein [Rhodovastum atsumiense]CAH2601120.1 conserved protein of unknown function [Rhodovastum atsumiense]